MKKEQSKKKEKGTKFSTTLMAESEEEEPLDEGERGQWKSWLKAQHSKKWK